MIESINQAGSAGGGVQSVVAGTGITVDNTDPENPIVNSAGIDTDEKAKVSANDTTAGYLNGKLVAGSGIGFTENNNGGNETLGIAVSNLDAGAITTGTIGTARLATGTASSSTFLRGDQTWASVGETTYTTTIADAENTTSQITLAQFTVPANTWADGETIHLDCLFTVDNNSGSTANITYTVGGTTLTDFTNTNVSYSSGFGAKRTFTKLRFVRVGSGVVYEAFTAHNVVNSYVGALPPFIGSGSVPAFDSAVTFTSNITLYFKIQFSLANASLYCRIENARAYKVPAGTV